MPPKRAASAKDKGTKTNTDNAGEDNKSPACRRMTHSTPPKPAAVDEETKEYYLMQIHELENRVER